MMHEVLADIFSRRVTIVGMGNTLRADDGAGVRVAEHLAALGADVVIAEDVIENYAFTIAESDAEQVLIIDAVRTGAEPGAIVLARFSDIAESAGVSSHKAALSMTVSILASHGKDVWFLGIEAEDIDIGSTMTARVAQSTAAVAEMLSRYCKEKVADVR
ncbi:MAG: hydrogenase maturation protease [Spirochaetota bacterium]